MPIPLYSTFTRIDVVEFIRAIETADALSALTVQHPTTGSIQYKSRNEMMQTLGTLYRRLGEIDGEKPAANGGMRSILPIIRSGY